MPSRSCQILQVFSVEVEARRAPRVSHFRAVMVLSWAWIVLMRLSFGGMPLRVMEPSAKPIANGFWSSCQSMWDTAGKRFEFNYV